MAKDLGAIIGGILATGIGIEAINHFGQGVVDDFFESVYNSAKYFPKDVLHDLSYIGDMWSSWGNKLTAQQGFPLAIGGMLVIAGLSAIYSGLRR